MTPQGRLTEISQIAGGLDWRKFKADLSLFTADGYPTGGDGTGRTSGPADPTYAAVIARSPNARAMEEIELDIHECYSAIRRIANRMASLSPSAVDVKAIARIHRCLEPTCDAMAVQAGFCWKHYRDDLEARRLAG